MNTDGRVTRFDFIVNDFQSRNNHQGDILVKSGIQPNRDYTSLPDYPNRRYFDGNIPCFQSIGNST